MTTSEGGPSGKPVFRMRANPPTDDPEKPLLEELPSEDDVEYVIEDLEAAESPAGGAAAACGCYCYYG
jgi:hypothetical protein